MLKWGGEIHCCGAFKLQRSSIPSTVLFGYCTGNVLWRRLYKRRNFTSLKHEQLQCHVSFSLYDNVRVLRGIRTHV